MSDLQHATSPSGTRPPTGDDEARALVERLAEPCTGRRGALLPLLHAIQHEVGWIPDSLVPFVAHALNLSRAEIHGVITFYPDFRRRPAGRHVVKLCRAEACQARGGAAIEAAAADRFGVAMGETRPDGQVTLEPIYCLGLCATGPNALVDGKPVSRVDAARLERIAAEIAA
ncbi:MAG: formate dehydrogenase subunit gamma [Sphingomonadaceae bacterium]|nr:formate dehydrogenase subunit gamma [Sphingomonadaceae bacterium]